MQMRKYWWSKYASIETSRVSKGDMRDTHNMQKKPLPWFPIPPKNDVLEKHNSMLA
jgi:hypothetical protein